MSDAEFLYLLLAAFYLGECAFWIRPGTFVFSTQLGERWRRANLRWSFLRNHDGGVLLGNLLPCGQAGLCQQWPLSLSPDGVYAYVAQAVSSDGRPNCPEKFVPFEDIRKIEIRGAALCINGAVFAWLTSVTSCRFYARALRRLKDMLAAERAAAIDKLLQDHLDATAVAARLRLCRAAGAELRLTCLTLFFLVYVLSLLFLVLQPSVFFFPIVGCYFGLTFLGCWQYRRAHRLLYPDEKWERRKHILFMLVSPADSVHALDRLYRHLLETYHPLAVAQAVCTRASFVELAGDVWRDLEHPILPVCPIEDTGPRATEAFFRERLKAAVEAFLREHQVPFLELRQSPPRDDGAAAAYCPRCLGQYVHEAATCETCGGRELLPLA